MLVQDVMSMEQAKAVGLLVEEQRVIPKLLMVCSRLVIEMLDCKTLTQPLALVTLTKRARVG